MTTTTRVPYGTHPKWEACVDCDTPKSGHGRHHPRCKSCGNKNKPTRAPLVGLDGTKVCTKCGELKDADEFGRHNQRPDGRDTKCKACKNRASAGYYQRWTPERRRRHRLHVASYRYGISRDLIESLYEQQEGCCSICGKHGSPPGVIENRRKGEILHIDHDHETGQVRGLLCSNCNLGLGRFGDSLHLLIRAAAYLERGETKCQ